MGVWIIKVSLFNIPKFLAVRSEIADVLLPTSGL